MIDVYEPKNESSAEVQLMLSVLLILYREDLPTTKALLIWAAVDLNWFDKLLFT